MRRGRSGRKRVDEREGGREEGENKHKNGAGIFSEDSSPILMISTACLHIRMSHFHPHLSPSLSSFCTPNFYPCHCSETEERGWQDSWKVMYPSHHHVDNISTDLETLPSHITCLQLSASLPEGFLQQHRRFLCL